MPRLRLPLAVVLLALHTAPADADESTRDVRALPCRPTVACTANIAPPGVVELEVGYAASLRTGAWQQGFPILLKLSATHWLQLQVAATASLVGTSASFTSVALGGKLHLQDQDGARPSVSLSAALGIPAVAASTWSLLATIYVSKDVRWLHFDFNLGASILGLEHTQHFQPLLALALSTELRHHVTPMLELHLITDAAPLAPLDAGVLAALSWAARGWLVFDAGLDVSFVQANRSVTLFAGVTIAPTRLWQPRR
jgi:hypothetical protein